MYVQLIVKAARSRYSDVDTGIRLHCVSPPTVISFISVLVKNPTKAADRDGNKARTGAAWRIFFMYLVENQLPNWT